MKIKCKVSKQLKRALKHKAASQEMERTAYILQSLKAHTQAAGISEDAVEAYKVFLEERTVNLNALKLALEDEHVEQEEKRQRLKEFYLTHHMYRPVVSKHRQMENIILQVDEMDYYILMMLADQSQQTVENYVEKILHFFK